MNAPADSYWQRTTPPLPLLSLDPPPSSVEIAVVGGGLLGAATCYWLARAGMHVVLLEREAMASGATGRNGGFVRIGPAGSYLDASERLGKDTARQIMAITHVPAPGPGGGSDRLRLSRTWFSAPGDLAGASRSLQERDHRAADGWLRGSLARSEQRSGHDQRATWGRSGRRAFAQGKGWSIGRALFTGS